MSFTDIAKILKDADKEKEVLTAKDSSIIYENMPSTTSYNMRIYPFYPYVQQYYQPTYYDVQTMLVEDEIKLLARALEKIWWMKILNDYTASTSQPSLSMFLHSNGDLY